MVAYLRAAEPGVYVPCATVAARLGVSRSTVLYHARKLREKVQVRSGPEGGLRLRPPPGPGLRTRPDLSAIRAMW